MIVPFSYCRKVLLLFVICSFYTFADTSSVDSVKSTPLINIALSSDTITFGDTVDVTCTPTVDSLDFTVKMPVEWQKFSTIRLVGSKKEDRATTLSFALYQQENCTIPSLIFSYPLSDTTSDTVSTGEIAVYVTKTIADTVTEMGSAGAPMKAGTFPYWIVILISVVILVAILFIFFGIHILDYILSLFGKKKQYVRVVPQIPPYDEAMAALQKLRDANYLGQGLHKIFTFELSDILKRYIGRRYDCQVHESTSTEFRQWIQESELAPEFKSSLNSFITETDPVKFANINPGAKKLNELESSVIDFVEKTNPAPVSEETEESPKESEVQ